MKPIGICLLFLSLQPTKTYTQDSLIFKDLPRDLFSISLIEIGWGYGFPAFTYERSIYNELTALVGGTFGMVSNAPSVDDDFNFGFWPAAFGELKNYYGLRKRSRKSEKISNYSIALFL